MAILNSSVGCDALGFVCRDGERKEHPKYCDEYYFCVRGKYIRKKCIYPDRWSVEHGQCERFHFVSCGKRIPKNHPCKYISSSHKPHEISISGVAYLVSPDVSELTVTRCVQTICRNYHSDSHFMFYLS